MESTEDSTSVSPEELKTPLEKELVEEEKDKIEEGEKVIITREDKKKKASNARKRGFYKKCLKRSSATDDIDSLTMPKEGTTTVKS